MIAKYERLTIEKNQSVKKILKYTSKMSVFFSSKDFEKLFIKCGLSF